MVIVLPTFCVFHPHWILSEGTQPGNVIQTGELVVETPPVVPDPDPNSDTTEKKVGKRGRDLRRRGTRIQI